MKKWLAISIGLIMLTGCTPKEKEYGAVVVQTDFGVKDGAVAAMKGVALSVNSNLNIVDLTHEIPAYNIWEAAYRLNQVIAFWPANTVFVSVVDPGVGTERKSIVVKTKKGHYIVTPDNGTTTLIAESEGIDAVRLIDEAINRRAGSDSSYTFHGRDVYMYTAARLASETIGFEEVGPELKEPLKAIAYQPAIIDGQTMKGNIPVLDPQYGNVWTNIPDSFLKKAGIKTGDSLQVSIQFNDSLVYTSVMPFVNTFGAVAEGKPLAYVNSLMNFSIAVNMGNFAQANTISSGPDWSLQVNKK